MQGEENRERFIAKEFVMKEKKLSKIRLERRTSRAHGK